MSNILRISSSLMGDFLITSGDLPVWPVRSEEETMALELVARQHDAILVETPCEVGQIGRTVGEVWILHERLERAGALYAHLTRRAFKGFLSDSQSDRKWESSVILAFADQMSAELASIAFMPETGTEAAGLLLIPNSSDGMEMVLTRSARLTFGHRGDQYLECYPRYRVQDCASDQVRILGPGSNVADLREALTAGAEVATILTHADGIDAFLHQNLSICSIGSVDGDRAAAPYCVETGRCFRHQIPTEKIAVSSHQLRPESIRARILVLAVCNGILLQSESLSSEWGFSSGFLESPTISALITTWGIVLPSPEIIRPLLTALYAGIPAGQAVAEFNRSRVAAAIGLRFGVFGDPAVRSLAPPMARPAETKTVQEPVRSARDLGNIAFFRSYFGGLQEQMPNYKSIVAAALDCLHDTELFLNRSPDNFLEESALRRIQERLLPGLLLSGTIAHNWLNLTWDRETSHGVCDQCGLSTLETTFSFRATHVAPRRLSICPRCGMVGDEPYDRRIRLLWDGRELQLVGLKGPGTVTAVVRCTCKVDDESVVESWPTDTSAALLRTFVPSTLPVGPVKVSAYLLIDTDLCVSSVMARRAHANPTSKDL